MAAQPQVSDGALVSTAIDDDEIALEHEQETGPLQEEEGGGGRLKRMLLIEELARYYQRLDGKKEAKGVGEVLREKWRRIGRERKVMWTVEYLTLQKRRY